MLKKSGIIERLCKLALRYLSNSVNQNTQTLSLLVNVVLLMVGRVQPSTAPGLGRRLALATRGR